MLKKFVDGLAFGAGFAIAFTAIGYFSAMVVAPRMIASRIGDVDTRLPVHVSSPAPDGERAAPEIPFHEAGIDEQIRRASVIAIARYERASDGQMKAIIREFLKKDAGVEIYYNVGDEYRTLSKYPRDNTKFGDGLVIFFEGSRAQMSMAMSYYGDRISGLGDIPLALFRDKCAKSSPVSLPDSVREPVAPSKNSP